MASAGRSWALRLLVALVIVALFFFHVFEGTLGIVLLIIAGVFVLTSFVSFRPMYVPLALTPARTNQKNNNTLFMY